MKILVVSESISYSMGGGRTGILGLCEALSRQGVDVTLFTSYFGEEDSIDRKLKIITNHQGFNVYYFPYLFSIMGSVISFTYLFKLFFMVPNYDLIIIHSIYKINSTFAAFCSRFFLIPYILRPHGSFDPYLINRRRTFLKKIYINFFELKSIKFSSAVLFSSELEKKQTFDQVGFIPNAIVIPEGINLNYFKKSVKIKNFNNDDNYFKILYLGRFHKKKGIEILIDAISLLVNKYKIKLVLAGGGESAYEKLLFDRVQSLKLQDSITFVGFLAEASKMEYLYSSDIFALASHGENFGLSLVEAMACSLPVVTTVGVGISSEISTSNAGIVTECNSLAFACGLETLFLNPDLITIMGQNARQLVCDKFNNDKMGFNLMNLLHNIINSHKSNFKV